MRRREPDQAPPCTRLLEIAFLVHRQRLADGFRGLPSSVVAESANNEKPVPSNKRGRASCADQSCSSAVNTGRTSIFARNAKLGEGVLQMVRKQRHSQKVRGGAPIVSPRSFGAEIIPVIDRSIPATKP